MCKSILFTFLVLFSLPSFSAVEVGTDIIVAGFFAGTEGNEVIGKAHNYIFFGSPSFSFGPMAYYESLGNKGYDTILGAGLKVGSSWYLLLSGGVFQRRYNKATGDGTGGILQVGKVFSNNIRISFSIIGKTITKGLPKRTRYDGSPLIGLRWMW